MKGGLYVRGLQFTSLVHCFEHAYSFIIILCSYEALNQVSLPAQAYSASLHPDKSVFVAGGEDFKIYKFAYDDGKEMGMSLT